MTTLLLFVLFLSLLSGLALLARAIRDRAPTSRTSVASPDPFAPIRAGLSELGRNDRTRERKALLRMYEENGFRPLWVTPGSLTEVGRNLLLCLADPRPDRLPIDERRFREVADLLHRAYPRQSSASLQAVVELEWALSKALWSRAVRMLEGRRPRARVGQDWSIQDKSPEPLEVFRFAETLGPARALNDLALSHESLTSLEAALAEYRNIQRLGGWARIPEGKALEPGDRSERIRDLRRRLAVTGDLRVHVETDRFDSDVEAAVRRFQMRHGLSPDGRVGRKTLAALNVPVEERVQTLALNLERRRWLPPNLGEDFVWVNVPEFRLRAFRGGKLVLDMPVVVGAPSSPTPSFQDEIERVVLNPYWDVPESIALGEIAPKAEADPGYLERGGFEVLDSRGELVPLEQFRVSDINERGYRIRRKPGPANDLGGIKFMLPNPFTVSLHDTPSRPLFEREFRAFSHGCIRLGRPLELAGYLAPDRFRLGELQREMVSGKERVVRLRSPMPIYLVYFTAWRSEDGLVHFRDDIYGRDERLRTELGMEKPTTRRGSAG